MVVFIGYIKIVNFFLYLEMDAPMCHFSMQRNFRVTKLPVLLFSIHLAFVTETAVGIARNHPPTLPWWSHGAHSKEVAMPMFILQTSMQQKKKHGYSDVMISWSLVMKRILARFWSKISLPRMRKILWEAIPVWLWMCIVMLMVQED